MFSNLLVNPTGSVPIAKAWCGRRDLNPHALRHWNLNPARLPIPPRPRVAPASGRPEASPSHLFRVSRCGCRDRSAKVYLSGPAKGNALCRTRGGTHRRPPALTPGTRFARIAFAAGPAPKISKFPGRPIPNWPKRWERNPALPATTPTPWLYHLHQPRQRGSGVIHQER
ncbi:protein of unknown function [Hyphomicrobium sp. 1Nfss2.1]